MLFKISYYIGPVRALLIASIYVVLKYIPQNSTNKYTKHDTQLMLRIIPNIIQ